VAAVIPSPLTWPSRVAAVAITMQTAMRVAKVDPVYTSIRSARYSRGVMPLSATADWTHTCMYGVILVPMVATTMNSAAPESFIEGTAVWWSADPQSGWARIAEIG